MKHQKLLFSIPMSILAISQKAAADSSQPAALVDPDNPQNLAPYIENITQWILGFAAALTVLFIIFAGFRFMASLGNPEATKRARNALTYAVIGLIILLLLNFFLPFIVNTIVDIYY